MEKEACSGNVTSIVLSGENAPEGFEHAIVEDREVIAWCKRKFDRDYLAYLVSLKELIHKPDHLVGFTDVMSEFFCHLKYLYQYSIEKEQDSNRFSSSSSQSLPSEGQPDSPSDSSGIHRSDDF